MLEYILFVIGFVLLVKGADFLVDGASSIAKRFHVSDLVIGLTLVSFGTSAPELVVNVISAVQGNTGIALGNIIGSNIANILLILGVAAVITPLQVGLSTIWKEIPFSLLAAIVLGVLSHDALFNGADHSVVGLGDGLILLSFFIIFLYYVFGIAKRGDLEGTDIPKLSIPFATGYVLLGLLFLNVGGKWVVDGAILLATALGISQTVIGLTIVAVGTSLPELATSAVAAFRKNLDIAIGNVVGSNIFNVFFILGITSLIRPIPLIASNSIDILMMIFATLLLFGSMFVFQRYHVGRVEGVLFLTTYVAYIVYLFSGLIL